MIINVQMSIFFFLKYLSDSVECTGEKDKKIENSFD